MDIKTLQYMQIRVRKAQELFRKLAVINETIELINNSKALSEISIEVPGGAKDLVRRHAGIENSNSNGGNSNRELYEILRPVLLNEFIDKRVKLQKELNEI
ncbi:hypothetical protein [Clostridium estertheticum]|uniref:Uncharacterized protein n=1 Tax=Clostridium estertheticum subsp. estertheticum TaxID=1552 RepID=A0A1J0GJI1_9CLOT|nr:hypothetical protein [Clostridium estertheticum]APC41088.1 hypothetical protein A7L45_13895 [Clostridium estertheticum subsp. estertheticum]